MITFSVSSKKEAQDMYAVHTSLQVLVTWRYPFVHPVQPLISAAVAASQVQQGALWLLGVEDEDEAADEAVLVSLLLRWKRLF